MLYLVRHGETHWNRVRRLQGQLDSPLTLRGVQQVIAFGKTLAPLLAGEPNVRFVASPLGRTRQTAAIIADVLNVPFADVEWDERLLERNQGAWDGLTADEIESRFHPEPYERRTWDFAPEGGESLADVHLRVSDFLASLEPGRTTVAVCHGVVSRVMRLAHQQLPTGEVMNIPSHKQDRFYRLHGSTVEDILCG